MDKLNKAYEAVDLLENLGLPVSNEQLNAIAEMEKDYLCNEIIPLIKQELEPLVEKMRNSFQLNLSYSMDGGMEIQLRESVKQVRSLLPEDESTGYRKKKFIIRVTFPDNRVSCHKIVTNTFIDVIKYAGAKNVERLGIMSLGQNIISTSLHENVKYQAYQHEIEPGIYVGTYCNTDRKYEFLRTINRELNLNLSIEKVLLD